MPEIIENLTLFDISTLIRKTLENLESIQSTKENDGFFQDLKKEITEKKTWDESSIRDLMSRIANFDALKIDGNIRESLQPGSRFVQYWSNHHGSDQVTLRTGLLETVDLFHAASNAMSDRRETFFASFPPEDMHCIGGNNSRSRDMIRLLNADGLNKIIMESYITAKAQMVERLKLFESPGNRVHVGRYFEYLLSLKSEKELLALDANAFVSAKNSPALVILEIMKDFLEVFKSKLAKELKGYTKDEVDLGCHIVVKEVNDDLELDGSQIPADFSSLDESQALGEDITCAWFESCN